jgi:glycerophosphoryl diester phosphodiesterase
MLVIAHRGANREAEENSWEAFEMAIDGGADRLELDVHLTRDGHPVVIHDPTLTRTTGLEGAVEALSRRDLERVKLKNGETLPFLDEVLERLLGRVEINVEIKSRHPKLAEAVAGLVKRRGELSKVIISSFVPMHLLYLADHHPELALACLWANEVDWPHLAFFSPLVFMTECRARILHPVVDFVTMGLMDQCRARGWRVYPYAPMKGEEGDREGLWAYLKTMGVDGLCTNYPREFKCWLNEVHQNEITLNQAR